MGHPVHSPGFISYKEIQGNDCVNVFIMTRKD